MEQTFKFSSHPDQSLTALLFTEVQNAKYDAYVCM